MSKARRVSLPCASVTFCCGMVMSTRCRAYRTRAVVPLVLPLAIGVGDLLTIRVGVERDAGGSLRFRLASEGAGRRRYLSASGRSWGREAGSEGIVARVVGRGRGDETVGEGLDQAVGHGVAVGAPDGGDEPLADGDEEQGLVAVEGRQVELGVGASTAASHDASASRSACWTQSASTFFLFVEAVASSAPRARF